MKNPRTVASAGVSDARGGIRAELLVPEDARRRLVGIGRGIDIGREIVRNRQHHRLGRIRNLTNHIAGRILHIDHLELRGAVRIGRLLRAILGRLLVGIADHAGKLRGGLVADSDRHTDSGQCREIVSRLRSARGGARRHRNSGGNTENDGLHARRVGLAGIGRRGRGRGASGGRRRFTLGLRRASKRAGRSKDGEAGRGQLEHRIFSVREIVRFRRDMNCDNGPYIPCQAWER